MISFSPDAARAFPSPARAGTSSQPEIGPHHAAPFTADTQEHTGLDELLYHMSTCLPAEFASLASTYRMTRAGHDPADASSSHAPPPPPPPPLDVHHVPWVPTYSSPPVIGFPVFDPSRIGSEYATPPFYQAHPHIIVSHSTGTLHHSRRGRSQHRSARQIRPSQQRLHRHHSPVALPGWSDRHHAAPEATGIPPVETIRPSFFGLHLPSWQPDRVCPACLQSPHLFSWRSIKSISFLILVERGAPCIYDAWLGSALSFAPYQIPSASLPISPFGYRVTTTKSVIFMIFGEQTRIIVEEFGVWLAC
ncbi:hypothetical protein PIB30_101695 [Stylosanthes scabra]|uniref:Uncharacterized protein n=1 Tax=Stylosanthes scabra TaxID=79078 RepID=A0ABU6XWF8_9FABA|nr:hypothetical protein [Stylosanthes scabra]